jgi:hypothetical protein
MRRDASEGSKGNERQYGIASKSHEQGHGTVLKAPYDVAAQYGAR